jgi:hypothetical protein
VSVRFVNLSTVTFRLPRGVMAPARTVIGSGVVWRTSNRAAVAEGHLGFSCERKRKNVQMCTLLSGLSGIQGALKGSTERRRRRS